MKTQNKNRKPYLAFESLDELRPLIVYLLTYVNKNECHIIATKQFGENEYTTGVSTPKLNFGIRGSTKEESYSRALHVLSFFEW